MGKIVAEIAAASKEQASGIEQAGLIFTEIDRGTQNNAATAEEMTSSVAMFKIA